MLCVEECRSCAYSSGFYPMPEEQRSLSRMCSLPQERHSPQFLCCISRRNLFTLFEENSTLPGTPSSLRQVSILCDFQLLGGCLASCAQLISSAQAQSSLLSVLPLPLTQLQFKCWQHFPTSQICGFLIPTRQLPTWMAQIISEVAINVVRALVTKPLQFEESVFNAYFSKKMCF